MLTATYGVRLEGFFKRVLKAAGIRQAESDFNAQALLLDAHRINPNRVARVNEFRMINKASADEILDWVYGIDHLIDVAAGDKVYAAIDLTANAAKVADKVTKAQSMRDMWAGLGVQQFFVVHLDGDPEDLTAAGRDAMLDALWVGMEKAFNAPAGRVHVIRLTIR